jgi:hypothetical protein
MQVLIQILHVVRIKESPKNAPKKEQIKSVFVAYQYHEALKLP